MATLVVGTDGEATSDALCEYLAGRVTSEDVVYVVNSLVGDGDEDEVRAGRAALDAVEARLGDRTSVRPRQLTRGNDPAADVLDVADEVDADEIVVGLDPRRTPVKKVVFGSVTQSLLMSAGRPVVVVPLPDGE